jgi:hypothetical protein
MSGRSARMRASKGRQSCVAGRSIHGFDPGEGFHPALDARSPNNADQICDFDLSESVIFGV